MNKKIFTLMVIITVDLFVNITNFIVFVDSHFQIINEIIKFNQLHSCVWLIASFISIF